jgi:hypothetical protein
VRLLGILLAALVSTACIEQADVSFFVLVKSSNYAQDSAGELTLLNYHFFSEIFLLSEGALESGTLALQDSGDPPLEFEDRGDNFYLEMGHYDTQQDVDRAHPNGTYLFSFTAPSVQLRNAPLDLAGPAGQTDIPAPITTASAYSTRASPSRGPIPRIAPTKLPSRPNASTRASLTRRLWNSPTLWTVG